MDAKQQQTLEVIQHVFAEAVAHLHQAPYDLVVIIRKKDADPGGAISVAMGSTIGDPAAELAMLASAIDQIKKSAGKEPIPFPPPATPASKN